MRLALLILSLIVPVFSWAAPSAAQIAQIDTVLDSAHTEYKAHHPAKALAHLNAALAQSTALPGYQARIDFFRARCLMDLHRPDEAREAIERFIVRSTEPEDKRRGRAWLAKVQRLFYGSIRVQCTKGETRVAIKGVKGKPRACPAQWDGIKPGQYTVLITGPKAKTLSVEVVAGQRLTYNHEKNTKKRTKLKAPTPMRFNWGVFTRAGLSMLEGTMPDGGSLTQSLAAEAGFWSSLMWPAGSVAWGLRVELGYRHWSAITTTDTVEQTVRTHGLTLPLLLQLDLPHQLSVRMGPAATFVAQAKSGDADLDTTPLGLMAVGGVAWRLPIRSMNLSTSLRYGRALTDVFERADLRRNQLQLGLEFGF